MGRPSVREERCEQILDALQECVLEYGLAGTTLARIADRAGVHPSAINHFVGTRDEVIAAALARSTDYYEALVDSLTDESLSRVLDSCIGEDSIEHTVEPGAIVLFDELLTLAPRDPEVRRRIENALNSLRQLIQRRLDLEYPAATAADRRAVALTITLVIDNLERHVVLDVIPVRDRRDARRAVDALLATLDQ